MTPKQREAHKAIQTHDFVLYGGAIRGGKTYWLLLELIGMCFTYPKSRWIVVRQSLPTLKQTVLVSFGKLVDQGLGQYIASYNQSTQTVTFNNGSQLIFMAESFDTDKELNRFRGLEINGAGIDEINEIQEVTFYKIFERAGSWTGSPKCPIKIIATANPTNNWVKEKIYDKWRDNTLNPRWAYIPAKITDNPHIPEDFIRNLKDNMPRYQYEVFVNGIWDISLKTGGEFYKCFELDSHVGKTSYDPLLALHLSWDENVNPYLPVGIFQIKGKHVMMIDEIAAKSPNNKIDWVCREITRKYYNHSSGMFVYGDATSQKEDVKQMQGHNLFRLIQQGLSQFKPQLRVSASNPSVVARGMFINTIFEKQFEGISVTIGDNCKIAIQDFVNLKEASDGNKHKEKETDTTTGVSYQKYGHFTDLFDYLICFAFRSEFERWQRGSVSFSNVQTGKRISKNGW